MPPLETAAKQEPAAAPESAGPERTEAPKKRLHVVVAQWLFAGLAALLLVRTLLQADLHRALTLVRNVGVAAPLLLVPAMLVLSFEVIAWRVALAPLGRRLSLARLAAVRLAADSLHMCLPGGIVLAESLSPILLRDEVGLPIPEATAATAARKWIGTRAHGLYIFTSAAFGWSFLVGRSPAILGVPAALPWLVVVLGLVPLAVSLAMQIAIWRGAIATRVWSLLARIPIASVRSWLSARQKAFAETDGELVRLVQQRWPRTTAATFVQLLGWLCESLEAYVIARVLGAPLAFHEVLAFEAGLSLVRNLAFFAPAGIGVQDLGYVAFFASTGASDAAAMGGAFVVIKRTREVLWITLGLGLLAIFAQRRRARA